MRPRPIAVALAVVALVLADLTTPGIGFTATERDPLWGKPMPDYTNETWHVNTKRETSADFMMRRRAEGRNVELAVNAPGFTARRLRFGGGFVIIRNTFRDCINGGD